MVMIPFKRRNNESETASKGNNDAYSHADSSNRVFGTSYSLLFMGYIL